MKFLNVWALAAALMLPMISCDDDNNNSTDEPEVNPADNLTLLVLNRGNYQSNNASLNQIDLATGDNVDIYQTANGNGLGDAAQDIWADESYYYVTVTNSNRIVKLDHTGKLLAEANPTDSVGGPVNPRSMVLNGGKLYVTYFYNHAVGVLDAETMQEEKRIPVGRYPEGITMANNKLYVANSGGNDYPNYGNTVSVIDLGTETVSDTIEVVINPTIVKADSEGDVYVISMGDYGDTKNILQRIDAETQEVDTLGNGTLITIANDKIYSIYAQYGSTSADMHFEVYNALTEQKESDNFIADGTTFTSPNSLDIDPTTGAIAICNYVYGETNTLYLFSSDGNQLVEPIDTKGYDSYKVLFLE